MLLEPIQEKVFLKFQSRKIIAIQQVYTRIGLLGRRSLSLGTYDVVDDTQRVSSCW